MNEMALASITSSSNFVQAPELVLSQAALDLAETFDPLDVSAMKNFGIAIVGKLAELTSQFTPRHQTTEVVDAVNVLQAMCDTVANSGLDQLSQPSIFSKLPLFGERFVSLPLCSHHFDVLKTQLDVLSYRLQKHLSKLGHEVKQIDILSRNCENLLLQLEVHIDAGQLRLAQLNHTVLPQLQEQAQKSGHILDSQHYQEASQAVMQLDERVYHLMMSRFAAMNIMPQLNLTQQGNKILHNDIQDIVRDTLPCWQIELSEALDCKDKIPAIEMVKNVTIFMTETISRALSHAKSGRTQRERSQPIINQSVDDLNEALSKALAEGD